MVLKLYYCCISPACRAVLLTLNALKLKANLVEVDVLSKKQLQDKLSGINPQRTLPTLVDDKAVVWDSHAINIYLVQKFAPDYALYPAEPLRRAAVNQRLHFDTGILYPCVYNCVVPILYKQITTLGAHHISTVKQVYNHLENFLAKTKWIADDNITIADFSCMASLSTLDYIFPVKTKSNPKLFHYLDRCQDLPQYDSCNQDGLNKLGQILQERVIKAVKIVDTMKKI